MEIPKQSEPKTIDAAEKTLDVIEALWKLDGAGVTELADFLDFSKSTVYFHLSTLKKKGYVVTDGDKYDLSLRFHSYGEYVKQSQPLSEIAESPVDDLADECDERVYCMVEQHGLIATLYMSQGNQALQSVLRSGKHAHMHIIAAGWAILAYRGEEFVDWVVDKWGLPKYTKNTVTTREELDAALKGGREKGYFHAQEQFKKGLSAIGAPIVDDERVYGAISIEAPDLRLQDKLEEGTIQNQLLETANLIQVNLNFAQV